ncbi:hypothetical protein BYT27DRAFT_6744163 [Phlegmacium glaucopus]|nr:hypothetical protein BYT27DRAFT_6744163 [Phlegmacium glaucopus]
MKFGGSQMKMGSSTLFVSLKKNSSQQSLYDCTELPEQKFKGTRHLSFCTARVRNETTVARVKLDRVLTKRLPIPRGGERVSYPKRFISMKSWRGRIKFVLLNCLATIHSSNKKLSSAAITLNPSYPKVVPKASPRVWHNTIFVYHYSYIPRRSSPPFHPPRSQRRYVSTNPSQHQLALLPSRL